MMIDMELANLITSRSNELEQIRKAELKEKLEKKLDMQSVLLMSIVLIGCVLAIGWLNTILAKL